MHDDAHTHGYSEQKNDLLKRLRRIEGHVRHATLVLDQWGFGRAMGARGRGWNLGGTD